MTTVYSVGHSTRAAAELLELLAEAGIATLVDVRRYPGSKRNPQYSRDTLEHSLSEAGIDYVWLGKGLGGRQRESVPVEQSVNRAWTVPAFRHYADAMVTPEFRGAFEALESLARVAPTAVLCAERLWWRCHRRLLADLLCVHGFEVRHLLEPRKQTPHELTEWARVQDSVLSYPGLL